MKRGTGATGGFGASKGDVALSVVIPAFNEETRLGATLERLLATLDHGLLDAEQTQVIVVDDGSSDSTAELARKALRPAPMSKVVRLPSNRGKGAAIRTGIQQADGASVAFMDADLSVDPEGLPALVAGLANAEVAMCSRALEESTVDCRSVRRTLMGRAFNWVARANTDLEYYDTQCGFKAFRAPAGRLLFHLATVDRFAFDVEVLLLARQLGMRVEEVPVSWRHREGSHIRPVRDPLSMVADVMRTRAGFSQRQPVPAILADPPSSATTRSPDSSEFAVAAATAMVRCTDLVVPWESGAAVLLPLTAPEELDVVRISLSNRLPGWKLTDASFKLGMIRELAPFSQAEEEAAPASSPRVAPEVRPVATHSAMAR